MQQASTATLPVAELAALQRFFDPILLADPAAHTLLDPATLAPTGPLTLPLPALDADGRGWLPVPHAGQTRLYLYQRLALQGRDCLLILGYALPQPEPAASREANAFRRLLCQYRDELRRDYVTGTYNRRYLNEEYGPQAAALAAQGPLSVVLARVEGYAALCAAEGAAAGDRCLNAAAGVLRLAAEPAWPGTALARWEEDTFLLAAAAEPAVLADAVRTAQQHSHCLFSITLARRASFTLRTAAAAWAEAPGWDALLALAAQRLDA